MVSKPTGYRGKWYATWDGTDYPCAHFHWLSAGRYRDPGGRLDSPEFVDMFNRLQETGRVLIRNSKPGSHLPNGGRNFDCSNCGYNGLWKVSEVQLDDENGLTFKLDKLLVKFD